MTKWRWYTMTMRSDDRTDDKTMGKYTISFNSPLPCDYCGKEIEELPEVCHLFIDSDNEFVSINFCSFQCFLNWLCETFIEGKPNYNASKQLNKE